ncbi:1-acyl-sn-glycerol-3-phosphate acyltransferase [Pseudomonadota bacterium]|nr:1-acyl-sn-glycerol-3-phosphate acyltransferase [Pseudomonadota bacterium]
MMTTKKNTYLSPINNLSFLDHLIFKLKIMIFVLTIIPLIIISFFLRNLIPFFGKWLPVIFHRLLLWLLSVKVEYEGYYKRAKDCNFFVSNHLSYLDIPILGSTFPLRFVAKSEVEFWPFFGFLSKLARTIFIKRNRLDSLIQKNKIRNFLSSGDKVLIFPEGTTSDGNRVLNFKSSSFSALENEKFLIQPIIIIYSDLNGIPINRWLRPVIAWYGDMDLKPHILKLVSLRPIKAKLIYLDPVCSNDFSSRKELSICLEKKIKDVYSTSFSKKLAR